MQHTIQQRIAAVCMALVMGLSFFPVHAFAEVATPETALEPSEEQQEQNGAALSDNAAAFLAAVSAFDADAMLAASNAWGLASQAWQADPDNEELSAALEDAIAAQDAACAPLYEAEDLYLTLSEEEQQLPDVAAAYVTLTALYAAVTSAMEHPVAPSDPQQPESNAEAILYDDLPDAPTGSYIGSRGLPVATGTTKVSLSGWNVNQLGGASDGYLDADTLNSDDLTLTVGLAQGEGYAIVPMMVQVEYPANGSSTRVELPETVTLLNYDGTPADDRAVLYAEYQETSAAVQGFYVRAADSFTATLHYTAPDGFTLSRTLHVNVDTAATASSPFAANGHAAVYADRPTPDVTSGVITSVQKVNGTWLIWFNGQEAYCCDNGLNGRPSGCPPYSYTATSVVSADQYTPGDHYGNQVRIWGGLEQLSMGLLTVRDSDSESENFARNLSTYADSAVLEYAARIYNSEQRYIIEHYPDSDAANNLTVLWLDNADYNADIEPTDHGGTKLITSGGVETTVTISKVSEAPAAEIQYKDASRTYCTDQSGTAANEDSYTATPTDGEMKNDRVLGEISLSKVDLDAVRTVPSHGDATLEGAVYDLYAAEDITHPDGVTGVVDYSQITRDGSPIWHTTIRDNSGQWVNDYLPVLKKDRLVASAEIRDGWLTFSNLYLGKYYIVERSTGVVIPLSDGALSVSGTYPVVNERTKEPTGQITALARNAAGQYTDWVYRNQFSNISKSKALDGTWTYDGYYLSFAEGYLADEHNYYITPTYENEGWYVEKTTFLDNRQGAGQQLDRTSYGAYYHLHADNALAESQDQVAKGNVEISKVVSGSGQSNGVTLENAGFTFFLVSELSKAGQFTTTRSGEYVLSSILSAYLNPNYDHSHPKWDFSGESQAIAKTYEVNAAEISAYNRTLTAAGEYRNGKGSGWVSTGIPNEYRLSEIFSSDTGNIRVQGLPYGTYLVVETTTPPDVYQAEPFLVSIDPAKDNNPWSRMATPKGSVMTGSDSYQKYTVLDEEIEVYLRITKLDEETGKPVLLPDTAFQIYWMDENGQYQTDDSGNRKLVTMTDTRNGHLTKDITTFYTNESGILTLPEKLPLGHYRIVEVSGPNGFFNEWTTDGSYYVDFTITTERIYQATGDQNENGMDTLVIGEEYHNSETLGRLTIRKTGEVLTGWDAAPGSILDPGMIGEAEGGNFRYEERPLAGAEYTITAAEDIYTQDRQKDAFGNRTLWYAAGDVVAVVSTGDGTRDAVSFAPGRTQATYDFLSVVHDGTVGEVSVTLPLGSYHIEETKPPYGYVGTADSYDVTFAWNSETNEVVMAKTITRHGAQEITGQYEVADSKDADAALVEQQTLKFRNEREQARAAAIKTDRETGSRLAGAVFNLYTRDAIYSADGVLLFDAGTLLATAQSDSEGLAEFEVDLPIQGERYGSGTAHDAATNSGKYFVREIRAPLGYYVNEAELDCVFESDGQTFKLLTVTCDDQPTECFLSKQDLTNDEELPGAALTIRDTDGNLVEEWISAATPHRITGLHLGEPYTLTETRPADGYALADSIVFRLVQKSDEAGRPLEQADVYLLTTHNFLFWTWDDWTLLADATVVMKDDTIKVNISKKDITTGEELPGATLVIHDSEGREVERWTSTATPHYIEKLPAGDYTLTEVSAPLGYAMAESVEFTVLPIGEIQTVTMLDDVIKVQISKQDMANGQELPGATLVIHDSEGQEVERWISTATPHHIEKLPAGDYTLTEINAPSGYAIANTVYFTVLPTGVIQTVTMLDDVIKVQISKQDMANGQELPGATMVIHDSEGQEVERWISTATPHYIEKLPAGDYTLTEISAPNGYHVAETIRFTIRPTGEIQTVTMKDKRIEPPPQGHPDTPDPPAPTPAPTPVPSPARTPTIPQTGDSFPVVLLVILLLASAAALFAVALYGRRNRLPKPIDKPKSK